MKVAIAVLIGILVGGAAVFVLTGDDDTLAPLPSTVTTFPTPSVSSEVTPTPSAEAAPNENSCSAAELGSIFTSGDPNAGLPPAVEEMRDRIISAASTCDYDELDQLALEGRPYFSYSFGVENSPSSFWRARERDARRMDRPELGYLGRLVQILNLPYCRERQDDGSGTDTLLVYYVWPRVHCSDRKPSHWNDLAGLYTDEQIDQMRAGDIYYGHRVGILEDGDWVYFIAGD